MYVYTHLMNAYELILIIGAFSTVYMGKIQRLDTDTSEHSEDIAVKTAKSELFMLGNVRK